MMIAELVANFIATATPLLGSLTTILNPVGPTGGTVLLAIATILRAITLPIATVLTTILGSITSLAGAIAGVLIL